MLLYRKCVHIQLNVPVLHKQSIKCSTQDISFIFNQYTLPYLAGMKFITISSEYILHTSGTALKILGYRFIELNESVFIILPWLVLSYSFLSVLRYQLYTVFLLRWKYYSNSDTVKQVEYFERTLYRIMVLNYELYSIIGTRIFFHASKDLPAHFRRWYLLPAGNINEVKSYPASTEEQRGAHKFTVHIRYKGLLQWP